MSEDDPRLRDAIKAKHDEDYEEIATWLRGPAGIVIAVVGVTAGIVGLILTFIPVG